jgi:hypothetical protein
MATCDNHIGECKHALFDLVDEMQWEDLIEFETLESAGLEDSFIADSVPAAQKVYYFEENK